MTLSERLLDHIGKFRRAAEQRVKEIVNELHKPVLKRVHQPLREVQSEQTIFLDEDEAVLGNLNSTGKTVFYCIDNICIKLAHILTPEEAAASGMQRASGLGASGLGSSMMQGHHQQQSSQIDEAMRKWKAYGHEFLSMDVMFDALYLLSKHDGKYKLRVPLATLVDFKGFRAVAVGQIPISPNYPPSLGFYQDGKYMNDQNLLYELKQVGDVLNLKENRYIFKNQTSHESVPVSFFLKVYIFQKPESKKKGHKDTPTKNSKIHFSELQYQEEPYYVLKTNEIFPLDLDLNDFHQSKQRYLRPEFVCAHEKPLKADSKKDIGAHISTNFKSKDEDVRMW